MRSAKKTSPRAHGRTPAIHPPPETARKKRRRNMGAESFCKHDQVIDEEEEAILIQDDIEAQAEAQTQEISRN
jgi:hypothetical protein